MSELLEKVRAMELRNIVAKVNAGKTLTRREWDIVETRTIEIQKGERFLTGGQIGKILGISRQAGDKKIGNGCLVRNEQELRAWENDRNNKMGKGENAPESINEARLLKLQLESEKTKWQISILKDEYVSREEVKTQAIQACAIFAAELNAMASDIPGQIAGLDEIAVREKLIPRIDLLIERVRSRLISISESKENDATE